MYTTSMLWRMLLSSQRRLKAKNAAIKTVENGSCLYDGVTILLADLLVAIETEYEQIEYMSILLNQVHYNA